MTKNPSEQSQTNANSQQEKEFANLPFPANEKMYHLLCCGKKKDEEFLIFSIQTSAANHHQLIADDQKD